MIANACQCISTPGEVISGTKALVLKREVGGNECRPCHLVTVNDEVCIEFTSGGLLSLKVCMS